MVGDLEVLAGSYAAEDTPGIHAFALTPDGTLRWRGSHAGVRNPSFLVLHPDGSHLYAVSETGAATDGQEGTVHAFRVERPGEAIHLLPLGRRPSGGDHPCHLGLDRTGRWLAVANYGTGSVSILPIGPGGDLGEATATVRHTGRGPHPGRQTGPHAHAAIFSVDNRFLMVADLGIDRVVVYAFDERGGTVARAGDLACEPGAGPRHLAVHPDGTHVFVVNELDSRLSVCALEPSSGRLRALHTVATLPEPHPGNLAAGVHLSPPGTHVYVSNRGHDSIATFAWEPGTGLQRSTVRPSGGRTPRSFALTPHGRHLVVANQGSDALTVLPVLPGGGDVGAAVARIGVTAPTCVVVRPGAS